MSTERTPQDIADDILSEYDLAVDDISLEDAIEAGEEVLYGIKSRLSGLQSDLARQRDA